MADLVRLAEPTAASSPPALARLPRILYAVMLDPGRKFGSMEEQIVLLARAFQEESGLLLPLFICADEDANVEQFRTRGIQAECQELRRFRWRTLWRLRRLLRKHRIDAVHWNFMPPLTNKYLWPLTVLTPRVRHLFTDHNSRTFPQPPPSRGWKRAFKSLLLKRYRQVWGVSEYVEQQLAEQGTWSNVVCCRHFINTDRFRPDAKVRAEVRQEMQARDQFVLLVVGQLIADKGIDVAIRAMTELPDHVVLWVAGAGPEHASLQRLIDQLGLQHRVKLLGLQPSVQPLMQAADCFVCPSLWGEAAGLVNLEAQACALPVAASRIGGIPEYVPDGRSGWLFEPGNAHELARQVRRLLDDPGMRERMGREARAVALEQFAPQVRLPEILDIYRRM